jgi:hypothetical protein
MLVDLSYPNSIGIATISISSKQRNFYQKDTKVKNLDDMVAEIFHPSYFILQPSVDFTAVLGIHSELEQLSFFRTKL